MDAFAASALPIWSKQQEIIDTVRKNPVTIIVGETGSGKTTQVPIFLYEAGFSNGKKIGVTEPRRKAAERVAKFVAKELDTKLGDKVGYQIRFDAQYAADTAVKFMTDGILLQEIQQDPLLNKYSVIVVDEAHERSENIDFTLGLLKELLPRRPDLKVIVTSATIDQEKFSRYFDNAPIINVSGRMYPVDIRWSQWDCSEDDAVYQVVSKVVDIHSHGEPGDVLVFMTGRDDINQVVQRLTEAKLSNLVALPIYGELADEEQNKIFADYPGQRKVIIATNIAETSLTIDGIVHVVDTGLIKQSNFHTDTGIKSLDTVQHSQAGCNQRAGRAGRVQNGICHRLYTKTNFALRPPYTVPEILRVSLTDVVLSMEAIGIEDVRAFPFLDAPPTAAFTEAYETLIALGAIIKKQKGLTEIGKRMAKLPLDARIARMVLEAEKYGCVVEVATIAAFLSIRNIFIRPKDLKRQYEADAAHHQFKGGISDCLDFLTIWKKYQAQNASKQWCYDNYLNGKLVEEAGKIRIQLLQVLEYCGVKLTSSDDSDVIRRSVVMGLAYNLFQHFSRGEYRDVSDGDRYMHIHPSSSLFRGFGDRFVVAAEIAQTTKVWGRICSKVELSWLPDIVPQYCEQSAPKVVSWVPGAEQADVAYEFTFKGSPAGQTIQQVDVREAMRIQEGWLDQAKDNGWVKLTFRKNKSDLCWEAELADGSLGISVMPTKEGAEYLCAIDHYTYSDFPRKRFVRIITQVFDFDTRQTEDNQSVDADALNRLADRWGTKIKK